MLGCLLIKWASLFPGIDNINMSYQAELVVGNITETLLAAADQGI